MAELEHLEAITNDLTQLSAIEGVILSQRLLEHTDVMSDTERYRLAQCINDLQNYLWPGATPVTSDDLPTPYDPNGDASDVDPSQ